MVQRHHRAGAKVLVKWMGPTAEDASWVNYHQLIQAFPDLVAEQGPIRGEECYRSRPIGVVQPILVFFFFWKQSEYYC